MIPARLRVSPLNTVVLLHHVVTSEDASNDADRTVEEIVKEIDNSGGYVSKGLLESALYCCNMENERGKFWHPLGMNFDRFVMGLLNNRQWFFDRIYNVLYEGKHGPNSKDKTRQAVGSNSRPAPGHSGAVPVQEDES